MKNSAFRPRSILSVAVLGLVAAFSPLACAQTPAPYSDAEAAKHVGETTAIRGVVVAVTTSKNGNTFLNFGAKFPSQTFTGFIPKRSTAAVGNVDGLKGKTVTVTGKISLYEGKPEIIINSASQIKADPP